MNAAQKATMLEIVAADCQIRGELANEEGQTCAIGGLAHAAGMTLDELREVQNFGETFALICEVYGITLAEARDIMGTNDGSRDSLEQRRIDVADFINTIPVVE